MKRNISLFLTACLLLAFAPAQGQDILQPLSTVDQRVANESFQAALEYNTSGIAANWHNPDANIYGMTIPVKTLQTATGQPCREFQQAIIIDNREQRGYGTACRQPDGSWQIVDPTTLRPVVKKAPKVTNVYVYEQPRRYYPYWHYPNALFFSFGYSEHRGHGYYDRHRRLHRSHFGDFDGRWRRGHRR